ncbi:MAG TPA: DUF202 domain-containing protein [Candidatus Paceibacterota bacterium]|jgi:putative membrane protein|nr:DUF202 domain-containing protein [Candidatus Paceibacterota bacterium]
MNINFIKDIRAIRNILKDKEDLDPEVYKEFLAKQLILRDYLAIERTILTNEATFLSYIRTGLTIIVVGVTLFKLAENYAVFQYTGALLVVIGFFTLVQGAARTVQMGNKIKKFLKKREEVIPPEMKSLL